jgi:hypothetical protein
VSGPTAPKRLTGSALALSIALGGTGAYAATGGNLILGKANTASSVTKLTSTSAGGALALSAPAGVAPLSVSGNTTKIPSLNADLLDGLDSTQLKTTVTVTPVQAQFSSQAQTGFLSGNAVCPTGATAVGGGFYLTNASQTVDTVMVSQPYSVGGVNGWSVTVGLGSSGQAHGLVVYAQCLTVR